MTGYGKAELNLPNANFTIEIKSLNSKQIDINVKMSSLYRDKEIGLRKLISEKLQRGKIELSIWREVSSLHPKYNLDIHQIEDYIVQIKKVTGTKYSEEGVFKYILPSILKMPNVVTKLEEGDEIEWEEVIKGVKFAINNLLQFRIAEGKKLEKDISSRIDKLSSLLKEIAPLSTRRIEKVKKSLKDKLTEIDSKNIDENRFEQELIYYLEKQDITEEQVRLDSHLKYFTESMKTDFPNGKKLAFIGQEIGREINTIGSKSSDAKMQKIVVVMKDELEKIKEQLLNIL